MVGEFLLDIVFNIASRFFAIVPVEWSADTSFFEYAGDILDIVAYILPWGHISAIVSLIFVVSLFRVVVALIKTFWDLLPLA